jgi:hypothetical protein
MSLNLMKLVLNTTTQWRLEVVVEEKAEAVKVVVKLLLPIKVKLSVRFVESQIMMLLDAGIGLILKL